MKILGWRVPLVALLLLATVPGQAGPGGCGKEDTLSPIPGSFEQIVVSTTALGFSAAKFAPDGDPPAAILAVLTVETSDVRFRADGLNPTAAVGDRISAGGALTVCGTLTIRRIRFIREDAADATLSVTYYREGQ
jgi:hypothetical protein